ncbi:hypothetical protein GCM10023205_12080 [Yinghuangia aomiensis]|uniref:Uncharacterized protein n=1 Tax=Yinghuangia aomiensis TaxID=676205 RepID=A0ABP9H126_9ACTN
MTRDSRDAAPADTEHDPRDAEPASSLCRQSRRWRHGAHRWPSPESGAKQLAAINDGRRWEDIAVLAPCDGYPGCGGYHLDWPQRGARR